MTASIAKMRPLVIAPTRNSFCTNAKRPPSCGGNTFAILPPNPKDEQLPTINRKFYRLSSESFHIGVIDEINTNRTGCRPRIHDGPMACVGDYLRQPGDIFSERTLKTHGRLNFIQIDRASVLHKQIHLKAFIVTDKVHIRLQSDIQPLLEHIRDDHRNRFVVDELSDAPCQKPKENLKRPAILQRQDFIDAALPSHSDICRLIMRQTSLVKPEVQLPIFTDTA